MKDDVSVFECIKTAFFQYYDLLKSILTFSFKLDFLKSFFGASILDENYIFSFGRTILKVVILSIFSYILSSYICFRICLLNKHIAKNIVSIFKPVSFVPIFLQIKFMSWFTPNEVRNKKMGIGICPYFCF